MECTFKTVMLSFRSLQLYKMSLASALVCGSPGKRKKENQLGNDLKLEVIHIGLIMPSEKKDQYVENSDIENVIIPCAESSLEHLILVKSFATDCIVLVLRYPFSLMKLRIVYYKYKALQMMI